MPIKTTESYIEKNFLYLLFLSFLLHVAMFALFYYLPQEKKVAKEEPVMIDLQDLPPVKEPPAGEKKDVKRYGEKRRRVPREMAPKGEMPRDRIARVPSRPAPPVEQPQRKGEEMAPSRPSEGRGGLFRKRPSEDLLRHGEGDSSGLARLFPKAEKLAKLEDSYRKKYGPEVHEGDVAYLDTNDIQFGSFLRRFENAVYGVWTYPEEAARQGIQGETPVVITFNRKGEIEKVEIMESSGSAILDSEVLRALRRIGPMGPLPKGYTKDKYHLLALFRYQFIGGISRSLR